MKASTLILILLTCISTCIYSQNITKDSSPAIEEQLCGSFSSNASDDYISFECLQEITDVELYDNDGKLVLQTKIYYNQLDISNLHEGFYLYHAYYNSKRIKKGIIRKVKRQTNYI